MKILRILFFIAFLVILVTGLSAQEEKQEVIVRINQVLDDKFPTLTVYVSVVNKTDHTPIVGLQSSGFKINIDSKDLGFPPKKDVFENSEEPVSYYYLMDNSNWMAGVVPFSVRGAQALAEEMGKETDNLSVYTFEENHATIFENRPYDDEMLEDLSRIVASDSAASARLYDKFIYFGRRINELNDDLKLDRNKRKVIYLITDATTDGNTNSQKAFLDYVAEFDYPIYSVGIQIFENYLDLLADISIKSGGYYLFARNPKDDLTDHVKTMHTMVEQSYILNFKVPKTVLKGDNNNYELQVVVDSRSRYGYDYELFTAYQPLIPLWVYIVIIVASVVILAGLIVLFFILQKKTRAEMGITKRKCPECKKRMKDDWDECLFCKYLPAKKKTK